MINGIFYHIYFIVLYQISGKIFHIRSVTKYGFNGSKWCRPRRDGWLCGILLFILSHLKNANRNRLKFTKILFSLNEP